MPPFAITWLLLFFFKTMRILTFVICLWYCCSNNSVGGQNIITTIAGTGTAGSSGDGGAATSAQLNNPAAVAVDTSGNIYLAEGNNNKIRVVIKNSPLLAVYVLGRVGMSPWNAIGGNQNAQWIWTDAGAATFTNTDLWTFSGSFLSTSSYMGTIEVCVDDLATVYLNGQMIQINVPWIDQNSSPQQSSILILTGTNNIVVNAQNTYGPAGLVLSIKDNNGNYVYTTGSSWKFQRTPGSITTIAGTGTAGNSGDGGAATSAQLNNPAALAVDASGNIYVADSSNNKIRVVTNNGPLLAVYVLGPVGMSGAGWGAISGNQNAQWIWSDAGAATSSNIDLWTFSGSFLSSSSYTGTIEVCVDDLATVYLNGQMIQSTNFFYYSGFHNFGAPQQSPISVLTGTNNIVVNAQNTGGAAGLVLSIKDNNGNYVYTTGSSWKFQRTPGSITTIAGTGTAGNSGDGGAATSAQFNYLRGVAVSKFGDLYIADLTNNNIRLVTWTTSIVTTIAGTGTAGSNGDGGAAINAQLNGPAGVAVDTSAILYIAEFYNNKIRLVNSAGIITTIAGTGTAGSSGDGGAATSAQLNGPVGIAVDSSGGGNIYIADNNNNKIRLLTRNTGIITTIVGTGTQGSSGDGGFAASAQLNFPQGVAFDQSGNGLYIAELQNNRIRYSSTSLLPYSYGPTRTIGFNSGVSCGANCVYGTAYGPGPCGDPNVAGTCFRNMQPVGNQGWTIGAGTFFILCPSCSKYTDATYGLPHFGGITQPGFLQTTQTTAAPWTGAISLTFNQVTVGNRYFVGFWQQNRDPAGFLASWIVSLGGSAVYTAVPYNSPQYINTTSVVAKSSQLTITFSATSSAFDWRSVWIGGATLYQSTVVPLSPTVTPDKYYLAVAIGLVAGFVAQPAFVCCGNGLYNATTGAWLEGGGRSYTVVRLSSSTGAILSTKSYDVYRWQYGAEDLSNDLNSYGSESVVAIYTSDEPMTNRLLGGMDTAMYRCGASATVFGSSNFQYRSAYILIGICGRGAGSGFEAYAGSVVNDLNAMVAVAFQITKSGFFASSNLCPVNTGSITGYSPCSVRPKGFYISASTSLTTPRPTTQPSHAPCSPGTYTTNPGLFIFLYICVANVLPLLVSHHYFFHKLGSSTCFPCASGSFSSSSGLSACTLCSGGYYAGSIGSSICTICSGPGRYSAAGASVCSQCSAGFIPANGGSSCSQCAGALACPVTPILYIMPSIISHFISPSAGSYAVSGSSSCTSCSSGYYATSGSSSSTACPANTYLAGTGGTSFSSCVACTAPATSLSGSSQCYVIPPTPAPTFATIAPSLAPSAVPTQVPSFPTGGQTQTVVVIYVTQTINGITASGANTVSFQNAFAIAVTNVFSVPVTSISGYSVLSLSRRTLLSSGVTVSYTLTVHNANPYTIAAQLSTATSYVQAQLVNTYPSLVLVGPTITLATVSPSSTPTIAPTTAAPIITSAPVVIQCMQVS